jgi:hypothetical protein
MADQAKVLSVEALDGLQHLLEQLSTRLDRIVDDAESEMDRSLRQIELARDHAADEVRYAEHELEAIEDEATDDETAEDDRRRECEDNLEAALTLLRRIERAQDEVTSAVTRFRGIGANGTDDILRNGIAFLDEKRSQLADYLAFKPGASVSARSAVSSSSPSITNQVNSAGAGTTDLSFDELSKLRLPAGFQWVRLDTISPKDALRSNEGFKKGVSRDDMVEGFSVLKTRVLPALQSNAAVDQELFRTMDIESGVYGTKPGLLKYYEAFFSKDDSIVLTQAAASSEYGVTNGRHRIEVARELGWSAVPAQVFTKDGRL